MQPLPMPAIAPDVVHETIDGEAIIINLATGTYFSLDGSGAEAWAQVQRAATIGDGAAALAAEHGADAAGLEAELARLLRELHDHGLTLTAPPADAAAPAGGGGSLGTFVPPKLGVFTDMEEFLLVDPIHQVEPAQGWPHVAAAE